MLVLTTITLVITDYSHNNDSGDINIGHGCSGGGNVCEVYCDKGDISCN